MPRPAIHEHQHARALAVAYGVQAALLILLVLIRWGGTAGWSAVLESAGADVERGFYAQLVRAQLIAGTVLAASALVAAIGIWRKRRWGRAAALMAAVLNLPLVPLGTALAVLTFWLAFAPASTTVEYRRVRSVADTFR